MADHAVAVPGEGEAPHIGCVQQRDQHGAHLRVGEIDDHVEVLCVEPVYQGFAGVEVIHQGEALVHDLADRPVEVEGVQGVEVGDQPAYLHEALVRQQGHPASGMCGLQAGDQGRGLDEIAHAGHVHDQDLHNPTHCFSLAQVHTSPMRRKIPSVSVISFPLWDWISRTTSVKASLSLS